MMAPHLPQMAVNLFNLHAVYPAGRHVSPQMGPDQGCFGDVAINFGFSPVSCRYLP
jgi:hypothetical protein